MSAFYIIFALLAAITVFPALDVFRHFRQARRRRQTQALLARALRQAVSEMGPSPEMPQTDELATDIV
jgi:hypothetical protein